MKLTPNALNKKHLEFSQRIVLVAFVSSLGIVLLTIGLNFLLLWLGKAAMEQETVATITTYGGITSGLSFSAYSTLTAIRSWSENKHVRKKEETHVDEP